MHNNFQYRGSAVKNNSSYLILFADMFLVYTMLAPYILKSVVFYTGMESNFFRTFCILSVPGVLSLLIYLKVYGIRVITENKTIFILFILFSLSFGFSISRHIEIDLAREHLNFYIAYCMFGFVLGAMANFSVFRARRLLRIFLPIIIFSLLYSTCLLYFSWPGMTKFTFPGINSAHMARILFFFAIILLFCFSLEEKNNRKAILFILLISVVVLGLYTNSRTAIIGFVFSSLLFSFHYSRITSSKLSFYLVTAFIVLSILLLAFLPNKRIQNRLIKGVTDIKLIANYFINDNSVAYKKVSRLRLWKEAYERFSENPVLGFGYKKYYSNKYHGVKKSYSHPHNIFLELFAETGIMGFIFFFLFFLFVFRKSLKLYKKMDDHPKSLFFFFPLCLILFFSFSLLHTKLSTEYFKWYFAGMITGFCINTRNNQLLTEK